MLEIGAGTGQATRPLAEREFQITAIELGPNLAAVARQGLAVLEHLPTKSGELLNVPGFRLSGDETVEISQIETYGNHRPWRAGNESRDVSTRVRVRASLGGEPAKQYVYRESVRAGMVDLVSAILEDRLPRVAGVDVWASLASAVAAREAAQSAQPMVPAKLPADLYSS